VAHIADPTRTIGRSKQGIDDPFLDIGAAVTHHVRGPPTAFEKRDQIRFDQLTVPSLAQAQANDFDLLQRQRLTLAEGGYRDSKDNERLLAASLNRKIGDAHPLLVEAALGLL
jgi:hypothetical protein